jgi:hypothetical protein
MAVSEPAAGGIARAHRSRRLGVVIVRSTLWLALCAGGGLLAAPAWSQTIGQSAIGTLHQSLQLTPQQEVAWKAYRDEAAVPEKAQERRRAAAKMFPTLTAPQRMDLVEAEMRQELLDLQRQSHALKAFYATLGLEQRSVFDKQTLPPRDNQSPEQ